MGTFASSHGEMHFRLPPEATLSRDPPTRPNEGRPRRPLNVESMIYRRLYPRSTVICLPCQFVKGNLPRVQSVYNMNYHPLGACSVASTIIGFASGKKRKKKTEEGEGGVSPPFSSSLELEVFIPLVCRTLVASNNFSFASSVGNR